MRPRLPKEDLHDIPKTVRLTDELLAFFEAEARRRDVPLAILMREVLVEHVRKEKHRRLAEFKKDANRITGTGPP